MIEACLVDCLVAGFELARTLELVTGDNLVNECVEGYIFCPFPGKRWKLRCRTG